MTVSTQVQLVQHLQPGGIETLAIDFCRLQHDEMTYLVSLEGRVDDAIRRWPRLADFRDRLIFLDKPAGYSPKTVLKLARLLREMNVTRLHTHHIGPMLYGGLAARWAGLTQWIHTEHDAWHLQNARHRQLFRFCVRYLKPELVADAGLVADQIQSQVQGVRSRVIYNGIDTERFYPGCSVRAREALNLPQDRQLIGCAARLHPVKGQHRLIRLLPQFPPRVELVLAGDGETGASLRQLANSLGVAERIHFLGQIDDMPQFYRAIDVFCLTSDFEGLPLSPLEAQACDTPVVVTNVGGASETACPVTGHCVALDDEVELRRAVAAAFLRPLKASPRDYVLQRFDVKNMINAYAALAQSA